MKKNILILTIIFVSAAAVFAAIINSNPKIIQGEIETKTVDLSSKIPGRIKKINVSKGNVVQKGDILIVLDTPDIEAKFKQADAAVELARSKELEVYNGARTEQKAMALNALNKAKSDMELAQKTYTRIKNLNAEGVVSDQKADEAFTMYKNAAQAVSIAQNNYQMVENGARYEEKLMAAANVKKARETQEEVKSYLNENLIKSPINGTVTELSVEEGELVGAGYTIAEISANDDNWAVFNLREDMLSKFKIGTEFYVKVPALGGQKIKVKVNYISAMGNFATWRATKIRGDFDLKTFEIHAKPTETIPDLRAGMSVIADWNKIGK